MTQDDGFAVIDFVDREQRRPGLAALLAAGGAPSIQVLTRVGPRRLYRVPETVARDAGLLDEPVSSPAGPVGPDVPSLDWTRRRLDAYARELGLDPAELSNKGEVLAAIQNQSSVTAGG